MLFATAAYAADGPATPIKHRITGLFSPDREADLREAIKKLPDLTLVSVDFENAEATFQYDSAKIFQNAKPEQIIERLDGMLKSVSHHSFGVRPLLAIPKEKLMRIEIAVLGLDCKGCCFGAYDSIYRMDGVEQVTVSFKEGRVMAWIDPAKTSRDALMAALKKRNVTLAPNP